VSIFKIADTMVNNWQERITRSPKFIDTDHAYIHEGIAFQKVFSGAESPSTDKYVFLTPAKKYVHWRPADIDIPKGQLIFSVYEDATGASTGPAGWTPVTGIYNHSRTSTAIASVKIYSATTSSGGPEIDTFPVYGGTGPGQTKQGASDGKDLEWVLARNTQYRLEINTTQAYHVRLYWYEEDDG